MENDSAPTSIIPLDGQHAEVSIDHCLTNNDEILVFDEFIDERGGYEQEEVVIGTDGTRFPSGNDKSQLDGPFITTDNKDPKDEELNLGKSHQDIPSTCEQGMIVVQREKAPSIEEDEEKQDESHVASSRIEYILDLLLSSSPSHGANHHLQSDTNMGRMRCTLSDKLCSMGKRPLGFLARPRTRDVSQPRGWVGNVPLPFPNSENFRKCLGDVKKYAGN
ncbi:hypothetical protein KI387_006566, partial [Taxus chinensis]